LRFSFTASCIFISEIMVGGKSFRQLTTFGVGGTAAYYRRVRRPEELIAAVRQARRLKVPYFILAGGSNIVGPDGRWPGLLIHYFAPRGKVAVVGLMITADASVPLASLVKTAVRHGLAGLEKLSGIPGTVGGAIVGNAGAYGRAISDCLVAMEIFDGEKRRWLKKKDCRFAYRDSVFKHRPWFVLQARFRFTKKSAPPILDRLAKEIIKTRAKKYPPHLFCPGSFFKNVLVKEVSSESLALIPPEKIIDGKIPAGYLLETVGACGMKAKHLEVASYHGNLLINRGGATAQEVKKLAALLQKRVFKKFGIRLEEEIIYVL
jgi:UDP-N-acetylmuramate dehydrogenase